MTFHDEVLLRKQRELLRGLGPLASRLGFALGGGTAIAIRLGHRTSMDLAWFAEALVDGLALAASLRDASVDLEVESVDAGTLHADAEGVRVSFLEYAYPLLEPPEEWEGHGCRLMSESDLTCMKLAAIAGRGAKRDFIDLFALGRAGHELPEMLASYQRKFGMTDVGHLLMSLTYFDDADAEDVPDLLWDVRWDEVKRTIEGWVTEYANRQTRRASPAESPGRLRDVGLDNVRWRA